MSKRSSAENDISDARMSLGEHLEELRTRLIRALLGLAVGMLISLIFAKSLVDIMAAPYFEAMSDAGLEPTFLATETTAGFVTFLRVALISGLVISAAWVFYQIWQFIAAGLYAHEKRYVYVAVPLSSGLFICGAIFFLTVVSVPALKFFIYFNRWMGLTTMITLESHIKMMTTMMLVFGIGFQTPLAVLLLAKMGVVTLSTLHHYRRHVVVVIIILAAGLTPPDPFSQLTLAVPMYLLYELGVVLTWLFVTRGEEA